MSARNDHRGGTVGRGFSCYLVYTLLRPEKF